jgi:DNA primase
MLLLYGDKTEEFEDALKSNGEGEIEHVIEKAISISQNLFKLQEDEVELANPLFRDIFNDLINYYLQKRLQFRAISDAFQPEFAQEVTDILMEDERIVLHN